ncbi:hypothetical protein GJ496_007641 [Pomphorhynchus laevis]|nr:hypothetical protein GJ496_007641 [Pomphorhynchus laevis]
MIVHRASKIIVQSAEAIVDFWRSLKMHENAPMTTYVDTNVYPAIKFRKLPECCNARWNSRAMLLAYFLCDELLPKLTQAAEFISDKWEYV